jgi:hypothetical protein
VLIPEVVTILEFVMICESMDTHLGATSPQTQHIYIIGPAGLMYLQCNEYIIVV